MSNNDNKITWGRTSSTMLCLGHESYVCASRVVAILEASSSPMKRTRDQASQDKRLFDATAGRKTKSVVVTDTGQIYLSALSPQTLQERLVGHGTGISPALIELEEGEFVS